MWRGRGVLFLALKMSQNSIDDVLIFDASDDSDRTAAAAADFDVYVEYSLESLSPSHGGVALGGRADFCVGDRHDAFPAPGWCDKSAPAVVLPTFDVLVAPEHANSPRVGNGYYRKMIFVRKDFHGQLQSCLLYTSPSPRD